MRRYGTALVLLYHRVAELERDPYSLCVRPDRFAEHVDHLARHADVVPLRDVLDDRRDRRIAVTFDDGYADNANVAAPVLRAAGLPATVFVATEGLETGTEFWWDRLEHLVFDSEHAQFLVIDIGGNPVRIDVRTPAGRARAARALNRRLRLRSAAEIEAALDAIATQTQAETAPCTSHSRVDLPTLRDLGADGLVEIGAHTRSHVRLAALNRDEQRTEIEGGRAELQRVLGRPVHSFAYPFGTPGTFDPTTVELVRAAGFALACANVPGRVHPRTDRYRIPRHLVGDWPPDELAHRLDAWFDGHDGD